MAIRFLIPTLFLCLGLAACGDDRDAGETEPGAPAQDSGNTERGLDDAVDTPDPDARFEPGEQSRELWSMIQEEHGNLTGEQQRALQTCAELELRDRDITVEKAVQQCFEELKAMAEEEEQASEAESGEG